MSRFGRRTAALTLSIFLISAVWGCSRDTRGSDTSDGWSVDATDTWVYPDTAADGGSTDTADTADSAASDTSETDASCDPSDRPVPVIDLDPGRLEHDELTRDALSSLQFDASGSQSPNGTVASYTWSLTRRPQGSAAEPTETDAPRTRLFLDMAGTYRLELTVTDDAGRTPCAPDALTIRAQPTETVRVRLTWTTPGDPDDTDDQGSDLNIHYLYASEANAQWNQSPWDIFWKNKSSDWSEPGKPSRSPSLDVDDTDGAGPENIVHPKPTDGTYAVAVEHFDDGGFGPSDARVDLFLGGRARKTFTRENLEGTDVWYVADIAIPGRNIAPVDQVTRGFPN